MGDEKHKTTCTVSIPITGTVEYEVEADTDEGAIEKAWEQYEGGIAGHVSWNAVDEIMTGNCFNGEQNSTEVTRRG